MVVRAGEPAIVHNLHFVWDKRNVHFNLSHMPFIHFSKEIDFIMLTNEVKFLLSS